MRLQVLTSKGVAKAALDYHAKGLLIAQHPEVTADYVAANDQGQECRCAIGAALKPKTLLAVMRQQQQPGTTKYLAVHALLGRFISTSTPIDESNLTRMQCLHDDWAKSGEPADEKQFLKFLNEVLAS
jgi:hypothetical protein